MSVIAVLSAPRLLPPRARFRTSNWFMCECRTSVTKYSSRFSAGHQEPKAIIIAWQPNYYGLDYTCLRESVIHFNDSPGLMCGVSVVIDARLLQRSIVNNLFIKENMCRARKFFGFMENNRHYSLSTTVPECCDFLHLYRILGLAYRCC